MANNRRSASGEDKGQYSCWVRARLKDRDYTEKMAGCYTEGTVRQDVVARRYIVSGRVQGVGFRNYVEHVAEKLGIDGYVRNQRDGSVEVLAVAEPERLKRLRSALEKGPTLSRVDKVREEPERLDERYVGQFVIEVSE